MFYIGDKVKFYNYDGRKRQGIITYIKYIGLSRYTLCNVYVPSDFSKYIVNTEFLTKIHNYELDIF